MTPGEKPGRLGLRTPHVKYRASQRTLHGLSAKGRVTSGEGKALDAGKSGTAWIVR